MVLVARNQDTLKAVSDEISQDFPDTKVLTVAVDLSKEEGVEEVFRQVSSVFGHADTLVNNAGVNSAGGPIIEVAPSAWWHDFEQNGFGQFLITRAFLHQLPASDHGSIVSMTTGAAYGVFPGMSAYSISKLVGLQLTAFVAAEHPNVTATALHPGVVATDMIVPSFAKFAKDSPDLVGAMVVYLCSERAQWLSGRFVSANWDVEDLEKRRDEVVEKGLLRLDLKGEFGAQQFDS